MKNIAIVCAILMNSCCLLAQESDCNKVSQISPQVDLVPQMEMNPAEEEAFWELIDGETRPIFRPNHFGEVKEEGKVVTSSSLPASITSVTASSDQEETTSRVITAATDQKVSHETGTVLNLTEDARKLFCAFQEETKAAKAAAELAENSNAKIDSDFEEWLNNSVDKRCFELAKINASKDKADAILKVANINVVRCDEGKKRTVLNSEEFIDLIGGLDFKKALEEANVTDHLLDDVIMNSKKGRMEAKDIIKAAEVAKEAWKKIAEDAKKCSEELLYDYICMQDEIITIGETIQYYHEDKQQLLRELSVYNNDTTHVYNKVIRTADNVFNQALGFKNDSLSSVKIGFHQSYTKMLEAKKSFDSIHQDAQDCLRTDNVNFQNEGSRSELNAAANNALYNIFKEQRVESIKKIKKAQDAGSKFIALLKQLGNAYFSLNDSLFDSCNDLKVKCLFDAIKILWGNTKNCAEESERAWGAATQATIAAKDLKVAWATNILRLAERDVGNFDLGEATNRDGKLLAALWLGSKYREIKLDDGKEALMSDDGLKRVRLLSYKPKEREYMMNFERRASANSAWKFENLSSPSTETAKSFVTPVLESSGMPYTFRALRSEVPCSSSASATLKIGSKTPTLSNGHLIIINPHDDYANNNSMSLKFDTLTSLQLKEAYTEKEAEMKTEANILFYKMSRAQESWQDINIQAQAAVHDGHIAEVDKLNNEANIIKQCLEKIIPQAIEAYQKGLDSAPECQQEWWRNQLDMIKSQAQTINAAWVNGGEERLDEEIRTLRINHAFLKKEIEKNQKAYDVIPELNEKLRAFWRKKVDDLDYIKDKQIAMICHDEARKVTNAVLEERTKFCTNANPFTDERVWDEMIQKIHNLIPLWDEAIEKYSKYLVKLPEEKSLLRASGKQSLEVVQNGKNQCIASECLTRAYKASWIAVRAHAKRATDSAGQQECRNDAMQKQEEAKIAFDHAIAILEQGLTAVSKSRKDLCAWWRKLFSDAQSIKNQFSKNNPMNLMEKINRAEITANVAYHKAIAAETEELWGEAAQRSEEAKVAHEEALKELEQDLRIADAPQSARVMLNQCSQQGHDKKNYWSAISFMCKGNKAVVIANLACSRAVAATATTEVVELWSDAAQKSEEAKVAWQKAVIAWQKALAECEEGPQKVALLQDWNQRLKFSQDQYNSWNEKALQFKAKREELVKATYQQRMKDMKDKRTKK